MEKKSQQDFEEQENTGVRSGRHTFLISGMTSFFLGVIHLLWFGVGIAKIVIGTMYIDDCDHEAMIPIWLIVDALIPILFVVGFIPHYKKKCSEDLKKYGLVCLAVAMIVNTGWSATGAVFIFSNWGDLKDGGDCDTVVSKFAFASLIIDWVVLNLLVQIFCFGYCSKRCGRDAVKRHRVKSNELCGRTHRED